LTSLALDKLVGGLGKFDGIMCPPLTFRAKRADNSQHIPRIALSFNGRTPGFGPGYRGSNPRGATLSRLPLPFMESTQCTSSFSQ